MLLFPFPQRLVLSQPKELQLMERILSGKLIRIIK